MRLFGSLSSFFAWCFWRCATSAVPAARLRQQRFTRLIIVVVVACLGGWWLRGSPYQVPINPDSVPTIEQIRALADLVTAKVTITDAHETTLGGYLGDVKAVLLIKGDALLGPDLVKANIVSVDTASKTVNIELPQPHLISYRLDHKATRLISFSHDGLWMIVPGDAGRIAVLNRAYAEAERTVGEVAMKSDAVNSAATQAERTLAVFFATGGWSVRVKWQMY